MGEKADAGTYGDVRQGKASGKPAKADCMTLSSIAVVVSHHASSGSLGYMDLSSLEPPVHSCLPGLAHTLKSMEWVIFWLCLSDLNQVPKNPLKAGKFP